MVIMVLVILLIIYRNPVTMLLPLITIGVSLVTAQAVVAGLAELGLGVSNQTIIFLNGMMFGAGTDYTVFRHQPLSRLLAARRGFGSSGEAGVDVHRQSSRRVRGHRCESPFLR